MMMHYFMPDWDDRVDPKYDFLTEEHSPRRDTYRDDRYAHELYGTPPYDGILLSRATLGASKAKEQAIRAAGSVHRYLRLPADGDHQVLGDCGAFSYWQEPEPPYRTEEVLDYYQDLGFDLGVSVDHLIFAEIEAEKERRWQLTVDNAERFLNLHKAGHYKFTPVGVAQGWDPASYRRAARALVRMGYRHIAIGGLVRSRTDDVLKILAAVHEETPLEIQVHLFGVNRPEYVSQFASLGVTSFDSASRLRRAWMDGRRNYFLRDDAYTAIRIPHAKDLARKRDVDEAEAQRLERPALDALRAYDRGEATLDETHRAVAAYAALAGDHPVRVARDYRNTLESQPWKACPCAICQKISVEVIIFRGNNRNRRRGFHNVWQLYRQLHSLAPALDPSTTLHQLELTF